MEGNTSFSSQVKREIALLSFSLLGRKAFLAAFIKCNGFLRLSSNGPSLDLSTEFSEVAELLYQSITALFKVPCHFSCVTSSSKKTMRFHVLVPHPEQILQELEIQDFTSKLPISLVTKEEGISAYLAGAFLACGYVNDPKTSNYHLEFCFNDEVFAGRFSRLINRAHNGNFVSKTAKRRKQTIVYIKKSEKISELLVYMGATQSCLDFENARVDRDFANIGNRLMNLDRANDSKKDNAAAKQIKEIRYLEKVGALEKVENPKITILCELRLQNPDASMGSLADLLSEEMGMTVSKSNINHLFRAIHTLYESSLEEGSEEE